METREDIDYMFHGFSSLVAMCINEIKIEVVLSRINSDIIENIFCQERSLYHGANTNPNYNEYRTGINSIILGQTTTSKKSNVGGYKARPLALGLPPKKMKLKVDGVGTDVSNDLDEKFDSELEKVSSRYFGNNIPSDDSITEHNLSLITSLELLVDICIS
ncbi:Hypothetical predicted protein [Mytilus galloprovincialis]|uniref:Uncharacterized protein n=1 Tax=Mytilus galloprovincialis TaxID=29158 RepID=A0A8B6CR72_MYTGA|nr:Hypothetical predicted protein [Mytilus galloprovincialis]